MEESQGFLKLLARRDHLTQVARESAAGFRRFGQMLQSDERQEQPPTEQGEKGR